MQSSSLLTWITFVPLIDAALILLLPKGKESTAKWLSALTTLVQMFLAGYIYVHFNKTTADFQFLVGPHAWIEAFNIQYYIYIRFF